MSEKQKAYRIVSELLETFLKNTDELRPEMWAKEPGLREALVKIAEANVSAGGLQHDLPADHKVPEPGTLAMGGIRRCDCGAEMHLELVCSNPKCGYEEEILVEVMPPKPTPENGAST